MRAPAPALALALLALSACSPKESTVPTRDGAPAPSGPVAEKGAPPASAPLAPATADNSPCASDDDCITTRYESGACCPMLCAPRAVTKAAALKQAKELQRCATLVACAQPLCRPPLFETRLACVEGRCVNQRVATPGAQ